MVSKEDLARIVGPERVVTDENALIGYSLDSSFVKGERPECIVKPRGLDEVQQLVKLANDKGFCLVPCSSRGPRSRGDTVPAVPGAVIVDLSEMKAIRRVDQRNKVAMIEPGVTFAELQAEVEKHGLRLEMPLTPRKTKSVLASLLEREPTTGPKYNWDAIDPLCCLELVFGTGDLFRTGNAAGPGSLDEQWASGQAQKVPMGPAQTDIARLIQGAQGSLGIATWATIKLELMPSLRKGYFVAGQSLEELMDFTFKILWRKFPDTCLILNDVNLAAISGLDQEDLPRWTLLYSISGLTHLPEERLDYMEQDLAEIAHENQVTPRRNLKGVAADQMVELVSRPSEEPYWKLRKAGACQDIFFLTTLDRTPEFVRAMDELSRELGFASENLGAYIQPIRHGTGCHLEFNLMYDPSSTEESDKVAGLFDRAGRACLDLGGFFSRPYGPWSKLAYAKCPDTVSALRKIKNIFDPRGVMNPGRLCFGKEA
jgi:FAD/FMN-containing dehydrogenase